MQWGHQPRFDNGRPGARAVALCGAALLTLLRPGAAGGDEAGACRQEPGELFEGIRQPTSRPDAEPKRDKEYPPADDPATGRGHQRPLTTLFAVHLAEAVPIFEGRRPPQRVLDELMRCRGFGERLSLDPRLLEAVLEAAAHFETERVEVVSAFRSEKFNESLAKKGRKVAVESRHTRGQAIDVRFSNKPAPEIGEWLWQRFEGGVGVYAGDDFVHLDVGPKRRWKGR